MDTATSKPTPAHLTWHAGRVSRTNRESLHEHRARVIWFTGLSGAGKSTLAYAVEEYLFHFGHRTYVLDGDNIRHGLCGDLGFSAEDRQENIRRVGELAKLFVDAGTIVLSAFISPIRADRELARQRFAEGDFLEIHCNASVAVCEERDVKGLYRKARQGEIADFTGISSPYEAPLSPDLVIDTGHSTIADSVLGILQLLAQRGVLNAASVASLAAFEMNGCR